VTVAPNYSSRPEPPHSFRDEIYTLVNATAPRLFAVVEEYATEDGDRGAHVVGWGLAHEDGSAQVAAGDGGFRMSLRSPERVAQLFSMCPGSVGNLVWPQVESDRDGLLA
jgi:hypothetical protein